MFCPECGHWNRGALAACGRCAAPLPSKTPETERPTDDLVRIRRATGTRYKVVRRIGSGGMADVYYAEQRQLARPVVIKVLHAHLARDLEVCERFKREAEAAAQLVHPHICSILDIGTSGESLFTVMPYFAGGSLADRIQRQRVVDPLVVAALASQVASALDYAHRRGVIHRDVKPDNVLFDEDGYAVLTDFGIATARFHSRLTAGGRAMGTPHYMSPEQAMGKLIDGRSDLYALGIVMYESLAGFPPFDGADPFSVSYKQVHEAPVPLLEVASGTPAPLALIVMRLLTKAAAGRYPHGRDVATTLNNFLAASVNAP